MHPVVEYEIREIEFERRKIEHENRKIEHEKRMKQSESESEIARLEQANSRPAHFEREHLSGSTPPPFTGDSYS